ncbi:unnamed protein product [Schistocephalus solidus]|uniref:Secreted protein n=1 Tax=Schistocephalus solidus TaxID=70667 RepID=A0A183TFM0_SCHSO|nr:unnamed protein product [Schistocephalus solidus]
MNTNWPSADAIPCLSFLRTALIATTASIVRERKWSPWLAPNRHANSSKLGPPAQTVSSATSIWMRITKVCVHGPLTCAHLKINICLSVPIQERSKY